jgi:5-methylcytosine-specific restriction endonuclease McrBC regulatory subunit McrC
MDRLMSHYNEVRSSCSWILNEQAPAPIAGQAELFGRFVRMNDVFESYVVRWMREKCKDPTVAVKGKCEPRPLCARGDDHNFGEPLIQHRMQPDIQIHWQANGSSECIAILDTKWKEISEKKPVSREDLYQMYAYAHEWLSDASEQKKLIGLIYPSTDEGEKISRFTFNRLPNVQGYALKFQLPTTEDNGTSWQEGFLDTHALESGFPYLIPASLIHS